MTAFPGATTGVYQPENRRHRMRRLSALPVAALCLWLGCGGASGAPAPRTGGDEAPADEDGASPDAERDLPPPRAAPVVAGEYRLSMSAVCDSKERTATGTLTLAPISGTDADASGQASAHVGDAALLWGQTDLDFGQFARCFGRSGVPSGEPIHPSVLVEVLRWDGERDHQVLLVSTELSRPDAARGGVAMWVERVDRGHIGGVWSRWELMGRGEGRWEAELVHER